MRKTLLGSSALVMVLGLTASLPAQAQTSTTPAAAPQVQEVVITAQKRRERLSNVAVTVDVVSAASLATQGVTDISDLNKVVPAVSLNASTNGRVPYAMRGVSTTADEGNVGLESGVGIMVDGISIPSDSHAAQQMVDLDNVQVLEGPQATLGGRTAAAGLIDMVTRSPKSVFGGQVDGTFTTDHEYRGDVFITGPISPGLDMSLSGYANTTPYPIKNLYNGTTTHQDAWGGRAKLEYKPDALLDGTLTLHGAHSVSHGDNFVYTYLSPGSTLLGVPLPIYTGGTTPDFSPAALLPGVTVNDKNLDNNSIVTDAGAIITDRDASLNVNYQLGDLTFGSTSAFQSESERDTQDLFNVDEYFFNVLTDGHASFDNNQVIDNEVRQFSQEFKVTSPAEDQFNYVAGLYASDLSVTSETRRVGLPPATDELLAHPETTTYDAYARVTEKFTPQISLTGGLRFNDDELRVQQTQYAVFGNPSDVQANAHTNSGALVGDISAKYNFDANNMVYGTYSRGYAPGAYNTATALNSPNAVSGTPGAYAPIGIASPIKRMDINDFEIGSKGRYLDGQLTVNADAFYTIYDNYQVETFASDGEVNPPLILTNAPEAQTHGVEASVTYLPTLESTITLSAAYIDATFVKYKDGECWFSTGPTAGTGCNPVSSAAGASLVQNLANKPLPNSPKFKFVINAEQRFPLTAIDYDLVAGATYTYRTSAQMLPDQSPYAVQGAFGLLNLDLGLQSDDEKYTATVFVNNVFNKVYYTDIEDFWNNVWGGVPKNESVIGQPGRDAHRFAGLRLSAKF